MLLGFASKKEKKKSLQVEVLVSPQQFIRHTRMEEQDELKHVSGVTGDQ